MKKAFDQTVRDLKREVNKKVLKVPAIEQKILDATSNEPWGPHGSLLADIAQATRNYHEYQIIMTAVWKRINDTGKNWRHVYKGLTVLEYLVAHGSERVIDEIREHAYQIATLSDFQYIDSSGRDQGSNVRKKSQGLVALVNDKERIHEVRQKAYANKDKYRSTFSTGGMRRPSSYPGSGSYGDHYDDDRHHGHYGNKEDDRNGYGRDRDWGYRDDDRYAYGRDGDRHRDSDERYGRDGYKNDEYKGNGGDDDSHYGSMDRNVERDRERSYDEDDQYPSRQTEHKFSERNVSAPPSYEEATGEPQSHVQTERVGAAVQVPLANVPSVSVPKASSPHACLDNDQTSATASATMPRSPYEVEAFDEFDPRGSATAVDSINSLALVPVTATTSEACLSKEADFSKNVPSSYDLNQSTEDPFGDSPFKAIPQANTASLQQPNFASVSPFPLSTGFSSTSEVPLPQILQTESFKGFDATMLNMDNHVSPPRMDFLPSDLAALQSSAWSHANLQPNTGFSSAAHPPAFQAIHSGNVQPDALNILPHSGLAAPPSPQMSQNLLPQTGHPATLAPQDLAASAAVPQPSPPNLHSQPGQSASMPTQAAANALSQSGLLTVVSPHVGPSGLLASGASQIVIPATAKSTQSNDKFETKSSVWADTLNRGLVNLNISGPKINPLADIGVDFDSINRKEKRREKERNSAVPLSTTSMGKAMGAGSGVGRAGAMGLALPPSPMVGSGMGMGAAMGNPGGTGLVMGGGYGGGMNNRPMGMGMGMGRGGVNVGMGQATGAMKPSTSIPPGAAMPGMGYNPMLGMSGYGSSQYGCR